MKIEVTWDKSSSGMVCYEAFLHTPDGYVYSLGVRFARSGTFYQDFVNGAVKKTRLAIRIWELERNEN